MSETVLKCIVSFKIDYVVQGTDGAELRNVFNYTRSFGNGTGSYQVGNIWEDQQRPLNTTSEDLDVFNDLDDFQGQPLSANNIKILVHHNQDLESGDYTQLKPGSGNPITSILGGTSPTLTVGPDGLCVLINPIDGYAVADGSADELGVTAADNSTYRQILGVDNA